MRYDIGFLDMEGIRTAAEWARREGWNPGLKDAEAFAAQDPEGFLGLKVDGAIGPQLALCQRVSASSRRSVQSRLPSAPGIAYTRTCPGCST